MLVCLQKMRYIESSPIITGGGGKEFLDVYFDRHVFLEDFRSRFSIEDLL
jgi:hypothetical protein